MELVIKSFIILILFHASDSLEACNEDTKSISLDNVNIQIQDNQINFNLFRDQEIVLNGLLGQDLNLENLPDPVICSEDQTCLDFASLAKLTINSKDEVCHQVTWETNHLKSLKDCFNLDNDHQWYGGPEEYYQRFPMNKEFQRDMVPYLPGDMLQDSKKYFGGVAEPYWLTSKGVSIWVPEGIPLFYSWNSDSSQGQICLSAQDIFPYEQQDTLHLRYTVCSMDNPRDMHLYAIENFLGKPSGIPDETMMRDPIWSSWAQYKANINESTILNFAQTINDNGFAVSQIEIDDNWESCYGDAVFDTQENKFPDPKGLISTIKERLCKSVKFI